MADIIVLNKNKRNLVNSSKELINRKHNVKLSHQKLCKLCVTSFCFLVDFWLLLPKNTWLESYQCTLLHYPVTSVFICNNVTLKRLLPQCNKVAINVDQQLTLERYELSAKTQCPKYESILLL